MRSRIIATAAGFATATFTATALFGDFSGSYLVPLDHKAIQYATAPERTRVTALQQRLQGGEASLAYSPEHGYLEAVLKELRVPVSSQVLVFSKTSFQAPRIAPRTPRALYHSDDTYVGYVQGGDVIEIAAIDPQLGVLFYTLDQERMAKPQITRRGDCLQCHAGNSTIGIPGLVVRSMHVERSGMPIFNAPSYVTDHRSPLGERWGGWYVSGTHGKQLHMGNVFVEDRSHPEGLDRSRGSNLTDLASLVDTHPYLAEGSDIVSLLVLEHKTRMTNLITRTGFEVRMALHDQRPLNEMEGIAPDHIRESTARRIRNAVEELLRYMLFIDEAPLESPVEGSARYAKDFTSEGPRDSRGRSLRDLDLRHRLLRYPCSFLIYSQSFDGLPSAARDQIYRRLHEILSGKDQSPEFARLSAVDRRAILEILRETKNGLPAYFGADAAVPPRP
jgi:hypothetical protein